MAEKKKFELKTILPIRIEALMSATEIYLDTNEAMCIAHTLLEMAIEETVTLKIHLLECLHECQRIASEG